MGWMTGFEPATSGSTIRRSNQLSYTHHAGVSGDLTRENVDLSKVRRKPATWRSSQPLASKAACISLRIVAAAAAGSAAARIGRPMTR